MNERVVIPCIFYYYLHYKLKEKYKDGAVLSTKEAMSFLFEWRIPEKIRPIVIKELEILELVERVNKKTIKLRPSSFTPGDIREFCKQVGIY